ncbi:MAG: hypothetical protein JWQ27_1 [Ferruginibacter sp.]|nr:hypothetical protein [Ferruginibacter sp.]
MKRINSIDIVRGIVMIIMALDHVRDLMHINAGTQSPTDLATTTPALFFTRWITYLCAPAFVFLAGTSAYLSAQKNNDIAATRRFLVSRGIYLVLLDLIVVGFLLFFDPGYHTILFEVIAAIGVGFILLGVCLRVKSRTLGIVGLIIICLHQLSSFLPVTGNPLLKNTVALLFAPGALPFPPRVFVMAYPPIPWFGIMLVGFASGPLFLMEAAKRKKLLLKTGAAALLLFVAIRMINWYGDPVAWTAQKNSLMTFLSFMNVTKYPPSFLFCLVTIGILFFMLALAERLPAIVIKITSVYGKVPLFYFLAHFLLIHLLMVGLMFLQGFHWADMDFASGNFGRPKNSPSGLSLGPVYLVWLGVVVLMYKPCQGYGRYKANHAHSWLKYL